MEGDVNNYVEQPVYQQAPSYNDPNKEVMTMGQWFITTLIMAIPCVGFIMTLVWAFGNGNENRKNFCRASLIWMVVGIVLLVIFYGSIFAMIAASSY
ncbi:hypothetical protein [Clostridium sp. chh4-2]|uniref:hypothetical protein n=1 Tax=Clostridium sp. chh4-2 TaxID=2067550 RepID=UPI001FA93131|nr:hypothetical protein [Clostridium sp. chh4-2]